MLEVRRKSTVLGSLLGFSIGFAVLFAAAETVTRAWWPDFVVGKNDELTSRGQRRLYGEMNGLPSRLPVPGWSPPADGARIVLVGDSITEGHGLAFEDTYVGILQRLFDALPDKGSLVVETAAAQGSNYEDNLERIFRIERARLSLVVYQFNYNDIVSVTRDELRRDRDTLESKFRRFRLQYLDRSAFLRVAQHVGGWAPAANDGKL